LCCSVLSCLVLCCSVRWLGRRTRCWTTPPSLPHAPSLLSLTHYPLRPSLSPLRPSPSSPPHTLPSVHPSPSLRLSLSAVCPSLRSKNCPATRAFARRSASSRAGSAQSEGPSPGFSRLLNRCVCVLVWVWVGAILSRWWQETTRRHTQARHTHKLSLPLSLPCALFAPGRKIDMLLLSPGLLCSQIELGTNHSYTHTHTHTHPLTRTHSLPLPALRSTTRGTASSKPTRKQTPRHTRAAPHITRLGSRWA
jgi:hypothetical protein